MPVIQSEIDVHGEGFAQNREAMLAAIASFRDVEQKVLDKANEAKAKFEGRPTELSFLKQAAVENGLTP